MLLSRLANHLFWFGRYLERTEHTTRFVHTQHYSVMESQSLAHKKVFYDSIAKMYGITNNRETLDDPDLLERSLLLNPDNPNSIAISVAQARANTLNIRDILSVEIYETVNRFQMFIENPPADMRTGGMNLEFIRRVVEFCALIRNLVNSTMLHDDAWAVIRLGIYTERAIQINRILMSQVSGISEMEGGPLHDALRFQQLVTLLKSLQAKDTFYKARRSGISVQTVSEFLVCYENFPRSILYNLQKSRNIYNRLFGFSEDDKAGYELNRMADMFRYLRPEPFRNGLLPFLEESYSKIEEIAFFIERDHLQI